MMYQISEIKQKKCKKPANKKWLVSKLRREDKPKFQGKKNTQKRGKTTPKKHNHLNVFYPPPLELSRHFLDANPHPS